MAAQGYQSPPADLVHAVGGKVSGDYNRLPEGGCHKLLSLGKYGKGLGDYTWGYRIYRTTYYKPNSDADFARAIEVLNEYIRAECFKYSNGDRVPEYMDGEANRQLWQRAKHDIVQDPGVLEGASGEKMLKLHQDWVHSHPSAKVTDHSFYRYFLVVDDEVINHLLQLPMPAKYEKTIPASYAIKLFDAWFSSGIYGGDDMELESDEDEDMSEEEEMTKAEDFIDVEGWFWVGVFNLVSFWMCEDNAAVEELSTSDKSWGGKRRPVYINTSFPVEGCGDAECRAMNHGFTLDEDVAGGE